MTLPRALALLLGASLWSTAQAAQPYTPASPDTVLLQRPPGAAKTLRAARGNDALADPVQRAAAVQTAIDLGHRSGDPRYFGQAQALLGKDWSATELAAPLRLQRAILRQQRHDFAGALADLDALLTQAPRHAQARLVRANVRMVQGEPDRARADCAGLIGQTGFLVIATCIGSANGLSGQGVSALQIIETALAREPEAPAHLRSWAFTQAGEIAERLGQLPRATQHYAQALAASVEAGEQDVYLKAAHANFLLDQNRADEVQAALSGETDFDPLLLRLAMAEQQRADAGNAQAKNAVALHTRALLARYALADQRGDPPHRREQTMTALYLQRDAQAALALAQQNWAIQHEPADARLLLAAALAAKSPAAAKPVLDWMAQTKIEDVRLRPLAVLLGATP